MKEPMSADEWFENNFDCYADTWIIENGCFPKEGEVIMAMTKEKFLEFKTYLLKHHLEQFAEECKENAKLTHKLNEDLGVNKKGFHFVITRGSINQTLSDYLTKNNI